MKTDVESPGVIYRGSLWQQSLQTRRSRRRHSTLLNADPLGGMSILDRGPFAPVLFLAFCFSSVAAACKCAQPMSSPEVNFERATIAFVGQAEEPARVGGNAIEYVAQRVRVLHLWKGPRLQIVEIRSTATSCRVTISEKEPELIYATHADGDALNIFRARACDGTKPVALANEDLSYLGEPEWKPVDP